MEITKKTIRDVSIEGKRILMRVDFNVPIKGGVIQDDTRIKAALPTINYILEHKAKSLVLMSHLGDPKKDLQKNNSDAKNNISTLEQLLCLKEDVNNQLDFAKTLHLS